MPQPGDPVRRGGKAAHTGREEGCQGARRGAQGEAPPIYHQIIRLFFVIGPFISRLVPSHHSITFVTRRPKKAMKAL